mgnify:CR=1 FL=1
MGLIDLTPAGYLTRFAKALVGAAGGLLGLGGGGTATAPPPPQIIDLGGGIVIPALESIPDNTILLMAGIILLAVYGGWSLIRGRRA